jgi:transposase-like protein
MERTPEEMRRIHIALETGKSIASAARLLDMNKESLRVIIDKNPELRSYLPNATEPSHVELLARKPLPVAEDQEKIVAAVKAADAQVRAGFEAIGVTGDAVAEAMAFKDFGKLHFNDMRHYLSGGMAKLFADLMVEVKDIRKEIEGVADVEREKILREDRSRVVKHLIDVHDRVREAALTAAVIESKKQEAKAKKKGGNAAFAPLAMQVKGDVHVHPPKKDETGTDDVTH